MTVGELRALLTQFDDGAEVTVCGLDVAAVWTQAGGRSLGIDTELPETLFDAQELARLVVLFRDPTAPREDDVDEDWDDESDTDED